MIVSMNFLCYYFYLSLLTIFMHAIHECLSSICLFIQLFSISRHLFLFLHISAQIESYNNINYTFFLRFFMIFFLNSILLNFLVYFFRFTSNVSTHKYSFNQRIINIQQWIFVDSCSIFTNSNSSNPA